MHGVQAPESADTVAGVVHEGDAQVGDDDGSQQLQRQRPVMGPEPGLRQQRRAQGDHQDAEAVEPFVDHGVQGIAQAIAVAAVPVPLVGQPGFRDEGDGDGRRHQGQQPG